MTITDNSFPNCSHLCFLTVQKPKLHIRPLDSTCLIEKHEHELPQGSKGQRAGQPHRLPPLSGYRETLMTVEDLSRLST